jgi:hypothetical protein
LHASEAPRGPSIKVIIEKKRIRALGLYSFKNKKTTYMPMKFDSLYLGNQLVQVFAETYLTVNKDLFIRQTF